MRTRLCGIDVIVAGVHGCGELGLVLGLEPGGARVECRAPVYRRRFVVARARVAGAVGVRIE